MIDDHGEYDAPKFCGKYRGKVVDNNDPKKSGCIRARVAHPLDGQISGWATPCTPYAGKNVGFYFIPPIDANVWIEFENGYQNHPIWSGVFGERVNWIMIKQILRKR